MSIKLSWRGPEDDAVLREAVHVLAGGGIVACPTETFYALAADAFQEQALERLFKIKGRETGKAILVLVADRDMAAEMAETISPAAEQLMSRFWPGPLTLVLPARVGLPQQLTAQTGTIGIRQPGHPLARRLCQLYGRPITGTSANLSGQEPLSRADEVEQELGTYIELILENSPCPGGLPSTILNLAKDPPRLVREGVIGLAELENQIGRIIDKN